MRCGKSLNRLDHCVRRFMIQQIPREERVREIDSGAATRHERKQCFDLGREAQSAVAIDTVMKRFDPKPIACSKEATRGGVPDLELKHSAKLLEAFLAPLGIRSQEHFRVGMTAE